MSEPEKGAKTHKEKEDTGTKYFWVKFHARSNPNDHEDVILSVNGETLICQREKRTCVPYPYLECADHGTYLKFTQEPGKPRKTIGHIKTYPYDVLGEATEDEFLGLKADGDRITKENIKRFGFDYIPDNIAEQ